MAVRFVIGRAGSGKTRRCLDALVAEMRARPLGPALFWLLPRQATFQAERALTVQMGAFCRARVVSFDTLGDAILGECGGNAIPQITALGRQMILGHLLRRHEGELQFFKGVARQVGLAVKLDATIAEFERCGKNAADLAALLHDMREGASPAEEQPLVAKLADIHLLYAAYTKYLGQDWLDPRRRLEQVLEHLPACSLIRNATIFVDGFLDFSHDERAMLAGLGGACALMEITVLMDPASRLLDTPDLIPDERGLFHRTEETYRKLFFALRERDVEMQEPLRLTGIRRFGAEVLARVEAEENEEAEAEEKLAGGDEAGLVFIEAPSPREEVDAAARRIRELMRAGSRLRDIVVLVRDLDSYHELIEASFHEHDIPFFADRRRTGAHHPLLQLIRAVFLIARHHWPHDAVMALLKSELVGLSLAEADEVENYVLEHRIRGAGWGQKEPWHYRRTLGREEDLPPPQLEQAERVDGLRRRVIDKLRPFLAELAASETMPVRQVVLALYGLLKELDVPRTIAGWMEEAAKRLDYEQRGEHEQVWAEVMALFDQMCDLLGTEQVSVEDFLDVLDSGLERFDLALTPPTVDQVLVGEIERTITPAVTHALVLGLAEGVFPATPREDSILSDRDRRDLQRRQLDVRGDGERRLLDERLLGYIAFTRASKQLIVSRPATDEKGNARRPSSFWNRLRAVAPEAPVEIVPRGEQEPARTVGTPRQAIAALMRWVRGLGDGDGSAESPRNDAPWPVLYQWLATHECCDDAIDTMRYRAWKALSYDNVAFLSAEISAAFFKSPLRATVAQIESFSSCPFQHFVRYGLRLRERQEEDVTQQDLSRVYHDILKELVRDLLMKRQDLAALEPAAAESRIEQLAGAVGSQLRGELMLSSARNQYLLGRIEKTLNEVVASQKAIGARGAFRPAYVDVTFNDDGGVLAALRLLTPRGNEVFVQGKIDRVDLTKEGAFAVIDYKLSGDVLSLDRVQHGISLQLLTYLLVLQSQGESLAGKKLTAAAAFYVQLLRRLEDVKNPQAAMAPDDPRYPLRVKPRGIFDAQFLPALDGDFSGGASDVVNAFVKKDGTIGWRNKSDAAEPAEFAALLQHVEKRLGELADEMISGKIDAAPYRMGQVTPCPRCAYRSVCRFDPAINQYNSVRQLGREEVLAQLAGGGNDV